LGIRGRSSKTASWKTVPAVGARIIARLESSKIRMLLPLNTTDEELEVAFSMLEKAMRRVAEERDLPC
jgi:signal transduction protein with GAF and PtsI domain